MEEDFSLIIRIVKKDDTAKSNGVFKADELLEMLKLNPIVKFFFSQLVKRPDRLIEVTIKSHLYNGTHYFDAV